MKYYRILAPACLPFSCLAVLLAASPLNARGLIPASLRAEYRVNPLGLEVQNPRLSWTVESDERGEKQSAYRVLAAGSPEALQGDRGDLWDSGKVESDETARIAYAGKPLRSGMRCWWKVMVWSADGTPSNWSEAALWSMGLLDPSDWKARWIGHDRALELAKKAAGSEAIAKAQWIWFPEGNPAASAPIGARYFRRAVEIPGERPFRKAVLEVAADNEAAIFVNGAKVGQANSFSSARSFEVTGHLRGGSNLIAVAVKNAGDSPNPAGLIAALQVEFEASEPIIIATDSSWLSTDQERKGWESPAQEAAGWGAAKAVGSNGIPPWGRVAVQALRLPPPRYLRRGFKLSKPIRRATLYASALGLYEIRLNGQRAGNDYFTPGWTDYDKRVYYQTYDVTALVKTGDNAIGGVIADGWYAGYVGFGGGRDHYGDKIRLLAQLEVEYAGGAADTIATGPEWKASTGPLLEADFLMGESYDARKEMPGWDAPGFDDSSWSAASVTEKVAARIEAHPGPPVNDIGALVPIQVTEPARGRFVFDLGQNFAGIARLKVKGSPGQAITLRFAEMLSADGNIYTENLRSARATDRYICRGGEEEVWQPSFTFHGFRYVELTGCSSRPGPEAITGIALSSDTPVVGRFQCSNDLINKLFSNISWTQRMNFIDIPTDCPQRDERLGWMGDAQIYCRTACRIADAQAFFTKWFIDIADAQREDGQFPMVAPLKSKGVTADGGPAWADAGVICPWTVYDLYGDRDVIEKHYASMRKFIEFCRNRSTPELLPPASFHCFGDWLNIRAETPKEVIYTAYFANSTRLFARMAEVLGRKDDAGRYGELFEKIKAAFNRAYVAPDGRIRGHTQTGYVLALAFDLLDAEKRKLAIQHLIDDLQGRDWHLSTGFIGTKDLMLVLSRIGRTEVAYRLLLNTTFPSWGFSIEHGATTIWERWNGWTPENGFFEPSMNSFAHYSFGAVGQWLFETAGGVNTDGPGFKRILIRPQPGGGLSWVKTSYDSIRGRIESDWEMKGEKFSLSIRIPANTTATVHVPASEAAPVSEGGKTAAQSEGVKFLRAEDSAAVFEVGSGRYRFTSTVKKSS